MQGPADRTASGGQVWAVFCHWDKPYFIEDQWNLLGVFTSREKADEQARRHEGYSASSEYHGSLKCACVIQPLLLDEYDKAGQ